MKKFYSKNKLLIFLINSAIILLIISNTSAINQNTNIHSVNISKNNVTNIPKLAWYPKSHDFGFVQEGNIYKTVFEIWNNGTGIMEWSLQIRDNWVKVNPYSGISSGEHDIINVSIDTTELNSGEYEGNVYIHSEGDYIYYTYFSITEAKLAFYPKYHDVGYIPKDENHTINFEIWNEGEGDLNWILHSNSDFISIIPSNGTSNNEHDIVNIALDPKNILSGKYNEKINITSDGGNDYLMINFTINNPPTIPNIDGKTKSKSGKEYLYKISSFDTEEDNISYFIDWGDDFKSNWSSFIPSGQIFNVTKIWNETGIYSIKVKAKDTYNSESNWGVLKVEVPTTNFLNNIFTKNILNIIKFFKNNLISNL